MAISTVNYRDAIFEHTDLSKIIGFPTYETLHLLHNKIKSNAMAVHSNLGGGQHGYLRLVISPPAYALLNNTNFVCQVHPENLITPIMATPQAQEKLKFQYDENLRVFHETRGLEQALSSNLYWPSKQDTSQPRETVPLDNS